MKKLLSRISLPGILISGILAIASCKKTEVLNMHEEQGKTSDMNPVCFDCDYLENAYTDSVDHPTILGDEIRNPYLLPNMKEAYRNVYHHDPAFPLAVTHLYVRFFPNSYTKLDRLEDEDIDLFDYPLNRRLITEGDYFDQPGKSLEDIPPFYSVVESGYKFPEGISYEVIDQMHIPANDPAWENEALKLTGNLEDGEIQNQVLSRMRVPEGNAGFGNLGNDNSCTQYPTGFVQVQDELAGGQSYRALRQVRVLVRRLYKIERLLTDARGYFSSNKYFRNKYTVLVKFRNSHARISRMRPWAIYEQFFPIKINFGTWDRLECNHRFSINHPRSAGTIATSHWCAAITQNGILEHREMLAAEGIGLPPENLVIMLSSKKGSGNGNTYMLNKILKTSHAIRGAESLISTVVALWSPIATGLSLLAAEAYRARSPDIKFGYGGDASFLTTDRYAELVYHELSHAAHYASVGNEWWLKLGLAENNNPGEGTYGRCCTVNAPCIALSEGWAYYMGHYLADKKWGTASTSFPEQGDLKLMQNTLMFSNSSNLSSHLVFLESYNPRRKEDPNAWIPKGLMYDLVDASGELFPQSNIRDLVHGFSNTKLFRALRPEVKDIYDYQKELLEQNPDSDPGAMKDLFRQYGY